MWFLALTQTCTRRLAVKTPRIAGYRKMTENGEPACSCFQNFRVNYWIPNNTFLLCTISYINITITIFLRALGILNIPTLMISIPTWSLASELDEGANDHGGMLIINGGMLRMPFAQQK